MARLRPANNHVNPTNGPLLYPRRECHSACPVDGLIASLPTRSLVWLLRRIAAGRVEPADVTCKEKRALAPTQARPPTDPGVIPQIGRTTRPCDDWGLILVGAHP